jgi:hypothetical protein
MPLSYHAEDPISSSMSNLLPLAPQLRSHTGQLSSR